MPDMLVRLYDMPKIDLDAKMKEEGILIKRAMALDKAAVFEFARDNYHYNWEFECEKAIFNHPSTCYIAVKEGKIVGFACFDTTSLGFFGPTGVLPEENGKGIGKALLGRCLEAMKEKGYGYAIIGYVTTAIEFYEKAVNAMVIEGSETNRSIYQNLIRVDGYEQ